MRKTIFITIAIIALLVQLIPVYWWAAFWTFWKFFIEKILEGGLFKEIVIGIDQTGNSIIGYCMSNSSCILSTLFDGSLSILFIIALIIPIWSFFSVKGMNSEKIYTKKRNLFFVIINIITIILAIILIILNKGFLPSL